MLLPASRFSATVDGVDDEGTSRLDGTLYRTAVGDAPAAASLPRMLAPEAPSLASTRVPFLLAISGLTLIAWRLRVRADETAKGLLFWAAAVACVVTSPAGWVMGLVLALPLAPLVAALAACRRLPRNPTVAVAVAWIAVALPAPVPGWAALAGAGLIGATVAAASAASRPNSPPLVPA